MAASIIIVGFFLTFMPQFILGLPRDAAALPELPGRVPDSQRDVHGRGEHPRARAT